MLPLHGVVVPALHVLPIPGQLTQVPLLPMVVPRHLSIDLELGRNILFRNG